MLQYRCFFKDCLDISGMPIANEVCVEFNINLDLLSPSTSTFSLLNVPSNIKLGDIVGLVDPFGTIIYTGVITLIGEQIQTRELLSLFDDSWLWRNPSGNTIEAKLRSIINSDFINSADPLIKQKFPFTLNVTSSTIGTFEEQEENYVCNFETFLMKLYSAWGVIVDISVPFTGAPLITIKKATHTPLKIGNNTQIILDLTPSSEIFETNKLVIYNKDGTSIRGSFYGTENGITTNAYDPLRLPIVKTKYVFNDDETLEDLKYQTLQEEMYNHKITFTILLDNNLYDFYSWELGMTFDVWVNNDYYSTLFTGYSLTNVNSEELYSAQIICGKVRNKLTEVVNGLK